MVLALNCTACITLTEMVPYDGVIVDTLFPLPYPRNTYPRKLVFSRRYHSSRAQTLQETPSFVSSLIPSTVPLRYKETIVPQAIGPELMSGEFSICDESGAPIPSAEVVITSAGVPVHRLATNEKGKAVFTPPAQASQQTEITVISNGFAPARLSLSNTRIDAMSLALQTQQGGPLDVIPTPIKDDDAASLLDIPVSGTVRTKSGKPLSSAHVQVRFTKADGLCACKWPTQTLTADRHGSFHLRIPNLGQFEFCAISPYLSKRCVTLATKHDVSEQHVSLILQR